MNGQWHGNIDLRVMQIRLAGYLETLRYGGVTAESKSRKLSERTVSYGRMQTKMRRGVWAVRSFSIARLTDA